MKERAPREISKYPVDTLIVDRYRVVETLGWGSMGFVLKATDTLLNDEVVALKVLFARNADDATNLARFRREVILARRIGHDNVVRVFDIGRTGEGDYFISMEFIQGVTLQKVLSKAALSFDAALPCIRGIAEGLLCAHQHSIIHRDLKPTNIMIDQDGTPKIADFGTARPFFSEEKLTQADEIIGTPLFIAPEIIRGKQADVRTDIYALGAIAYTAVEATPPFYSPNWSVLANMHVNAPIPECKADGVPHWYSEMIELCLAKEPEDRFQSAEELIRFIDNHTKRRRSFPFLPFFSNA
jgi:serine/threonine protein kinase